MLTPLFALSGPRATLLHVLLCVATSLPPSVRTLGMVIDVARTSTMHAAAPHFLWPFAVRYAAHQINLHPRVSRPETSPALLWTGKVGDASAFRVWGSRAFVRDLSADKLSPCAAPCVFLGFPPDAPGWQFYHPTSRHVLSSQDVTFDERGPRLASCRLRRAAAICGVPVVVMEVVLVGREWFARRWRRAAGAGGSSATEGAAVAGPGGARTVSTGAAGPAVSTGAGAAEGAGSETTTGGLAGGTPGAAGVSGAVGGAAGEGAPAGGTGAVPAVSSVAARPRPYFLQPTSPLPAPSPYTGPTGGLAERREPASRPASPVSAARTRGRSSRQRPPPVPGTHRMSLRPSTAPLRVPLPSPPESSLPALADPESDSLRAASPTVTRLLATVVTDPSFESTAASALVTELVEFPAHCRLDYAASLVAESVSVCPPSVGGECALGTDVLEDMQEDFQCLAAASPHLVSVLLTPEGDPDALDIPTPRSYAEAIEGTYVDAVPPPGANIVTGMWIFRVKRPPGSPPVFKARYVARGFSQRQGVDYFQTFSPTPKMTTLRPARGDLAAPPTWLHWVFSSCYPVEPPAASLRSPPGTL
ncbi:unnamed protein product [Closterium sp. NIES-53]